MLTSQFTFMHLKQPKIIQGVQYQRSSASLNFVSGQSRFALDLDSDQLAESVEQVLNDLVPGTMEMAELARRHDAALAPYDTRTLIDILLGENILTESKPFGAARDGASLFHELRAHFRSHIAPSFADEPGAVKFSQGALTQEELKAWSIEYYFTTRFAEQCTVAALNHHGKPGLQALIEEFFIEEVGHDKLLERSLIGFGFTRTDLEQLSPHISTVAVMGMLLRSSLFDLPLFITLVGQLEGTEAQCRRYIAMLEKSGLPEDAIRPQITHELINIEHGHFDEALKMAVALESVGDQDIARCRRLLSLYGEMRKTVYPWVFPGTASTRPLTAEHYRDAWRSYAPSIKKTVLPIACANASESVARGLVRDFVELRKHPAIEWTADGDQHVAGAILEYSLWKLAYQEPGHIASIFAWLDATAHGATAEADAVPGFLRAAFAPTR